MSSICKIIGHKRPAGYGASRPGYGHAFRFATDGTGVEHWAVHENCERCGHAFRVAQFHRKARQVFDYNRNPNTS
jgi:hypothetical protein